MEEVITMNIAVKVLKVDTDIKKGEFDGMKGVYVTEKRVMQVRNKHQLKYIPFTTSKKIEIDKNEKGEYIIEDETVSFWTPLVAKNKYAEIMAKLDDMKELKTIDLTIKDIVRKHRKEQIKEELESLERNIYNLSELIKKMEALKDYLEESSNNEAEAEAEANNKGDVNAK